MRRLVAALVVAAVAVVALGGTSAAAVPFSETFDQPLTGWTGGAAFGVADLVAVGGRGVSAAGNAPAVAFKKHGRNVSGAWTIELDASASFLVDGGGVDVALVNMSTWKGYGMFIGNAYHVQAWTGGLQHTNNTNSGRTVNPVHVKLTHQTNGEFAIYENGVFQTGTNLRGMVAGDTVLVSLYGPNAWIDNLTIREGI